MRLCVFLLWTSTCMWPLLPFQSLTGSYRSFQNVAQASPLPGYAPESLHPISLLRTLVCLAYACDVRDMVSVRPFLGLFPFLGRELSGGRTVP